MKTGARAAIVLALLMLGAATAPGADRLDVRTALRLLRSRRAEDRETAVRALADVPGSSALRLLLEALADEDADVRDAAETAVGDRRSADDREVLLEKGLRHRDPRVRRSVLAALAGMGASELDDRLADLVADRDATVREAAVGVIEQRLGERGANLLAAAVENGREGRPRAAALLALERLNPERAVALAPFVRGFPALEVRVAALEVLSGAPGDEAFAALKAGLGDESWSVRLTAMRGLARRLDPRAVPSLIERLRREGGRMKEEAGAALSSLTGVGLPPDPDRWAEWWEREGGKFVAPERAAKPAAGEDGSVATFHSIPVISDGVAFVLDHSRSMRRRLDRGGETTKAELVEAELEKTLARLDARARLFLVAFGTEPVVFTPHPVPATRMARHRALEWLHDLVPHGRTNLYDSLRLALAEPEIDTIFVLTDGAPSAGEERTRTGILDGVARLNRYRKAVIHTIEIGGETTGKRWKGFLAELAKRHGGRSVRR